MTPELIGDTYYGAWYTVTKDLNQDSIVYSFGVGTDISWDLEMIRRFGCTVYAYDPNPIAVEYVNSLDLPPKFRFSPIGIATHDGDQAFYGRRGKVSTSTIKKIGESVVLPVKTLQTLMRENGHDHIDVLKMDIEGSEFTVLPAARVSIQQILVEFHTSFYREGWKGMRRWWGLMRRSFVIFLLRMRGFQILKRHKTEDYSFYKKIKKAAAYGCRF